MDSNVLGIAFACFLALALARGGVWLLVIVVSSVIAILAKWMSGPGRGLR